MSLADIYNLAQDTTPGGFFSRVEAQLVASAISIANEVTADQQTISMGAVTAGTFTLNFLGQTTAAIQWNTSASALQAALNALTTITSGGVECTGGPLPSTPIVVNFVGSNLNGGQPVMGHTDTLTGGSASIAHTTTGVWVVNHTKRVTLAKQVVNSSLSYTQNMILGVAANSQVQTDYTSTHQSSSVTDTDILNAISAMWNAYS
jgi:hypothetical protein